MFSTDITAPVAATTEPTTELQAVPVARPLDDTELKFIGGGMAVFANC